MKIQILALLVVLSASASSCGKSSVEDADEVTQSVGDMMASVDESSGNSSGALSQYLPATDSQFAQMNRRWTDRFSLIPEANATTCASWSASSFATCSSGVITRNFDTGGSGCTIGLATLSGTVSLTFKDSTGATASACTFSTGYSITRAPNYTITGRRGATITVSSDGGGQKLTKTGTGAYTWDTLGVRRVATSAAGATVFDISTKTNSSITVTGAPRAGRTITGGELQVTHNLKNYVVKLVPTDVTWTSGCNCPTSGKWTGSATGDETSDSFTIDITGCGTASVTANDTATPVTFDRCGAGL